MPVRPPPGRAAAACWYPLIDRAPTIHQIPRRELLYRSAYELGRHLIGYELQKVLAAVDWFEREAQQQGRPARIGVIGWGEGGMLALYAAAVDTRLAVACVSGYFDSRQTLWQQPIERNVFGLLEQFGDAELASLIAPRALIVEAAVGPERVIPAGTGRAAPSCLPPALSVAGRSACPRAGRQVAACPAPGIGGQREWQRYIALPRATAFLDALPTVRPPRWALLNICAPRLTRPPPARQAHGWTSQSMAAATGQRRASFCQPDIVGGTLSGDHRAVSHVLLRRGDWPVRASACP